MVEMKREVTTEVYGLVEILLTTHLLQTFISAMVPMKGFLSKGYRPTIKIRCEFGAAPVMMLLSNLPRLKTLKRENISHKNVLPTIHIEVCVRVND